MIYINYKIDLNLYNIMHIINNRCLKFYTFNISNAYFNHEQMFQYYLNLIFFVFQQLTY